MDLILPLTGTGRKYGYIIWRQDQDSKLREALRNAEIVALVLPGAIERRKKVDWKHHRISIGYSVTRTLPEGASVIHLRARATGQIEVSFR